MPRRTLAVCLVLLAVLSGCRFSTKTAAPIAVDFTCQFRAQYENMTAAGTLTRHTAGTLKLDFFEPETLSDITVEWDGEDTRLKYKGLSFRVDPDAIPESALGNELITVFDAALRGEGDCRTEKGIATLRGSENGTAYVYTYDVTSGVPISLSVPSIPLSVTFSEVQAS